MSTTTIVRGLDVQIKTPPSPSRPEAHTNKLEVQIRRGLNSVDAAIALHSKESEWVGLNNDFQFPISKESKWVGLNNDYIMPDARSP